ncbi:MAG: tRNA-binding protein [Saprospiraceae bacterium]
MIDLTNLEAIDFADFLKVKMAVGTIISAELNPKARKSAYKLTIDFGDLGLKTSSAQITENYTPDDLQNKQIIAVMNFRPKRIAGVKSEVLVLAAVCEKKGTVLLNPSMLVENGTRIL